MQNNYNYIVGIDPGMNTGLCIYDKVKKHFEISTVMIHQAMMEVLRVQAIGCTIVYFEDARLRRWFGKAGREVLQGVGSINRDCKIWECFLTNNETVFKSVAPSPGRTKWNKSYFDKVMANYGWKGQSSQHARDATCLILGLI